MVQLDEFRTCWIPFESIQDMLLVNIESSELQCHWDCPWDSSFDPLDLHLGNWITIWFLQRRSEYAPARCEGVVLSNSCLFLFYLLTPTCFGCSKASFRAVLGLASTLKSQHSSTVERMRKQTTLKEKKNLTDYWRQWWKATTTTTTTAAMIVITL